MSLDTVQTGNITLPDAPAIAGLSFRHFRGDEDYPAMLEVNTGSKIADSMGNDLHTLASLKYAYGTTKNHDPHRDVLIAEVDGKMVAFNRVFWENELEGNRIYSHFGFVLPEWRGKGVGAAFIRHIERRAREIDASAPSPAKGVSFLSTTARDTMVGLEELLKSGGYEGVRYEFHMETPNLEHIPDAPMPEGVEVRPAKPEHYRAVMEANAEAFRDHWGAEETDETDLDRWINDPMSQPALWVVAWDGDQVAGSILNFINHEYNQKFGRKLGYTESISVRRPWRRRGLARAMIALSQHKHKELGMEQVALGVDTQNPSGALQLYESMGYEVTGRETVYRKQL